MPTFSHAGKPRPAPAVRAQVFLAVPAAPTPVGLPQCRKAEAGLWRGANDSPVPWILFMLEGVGGGRFPTGADLDPLVHAGDAFCRVREAVPAGTPVALPCGCQGVGWQDRARRGELPRAPARGVVEHRRVGAAGLNAGLRTGQGSPTFGLRAECDVAARIGCARVDPSRVELCRCLGEARLWLAAARTHRGEAAVSVQAMSRRGSERGKRHCF